MTMNDVILLTLMRRKTNMINSRQIVEILNEEINKNKDIENVRLALQKVKDRIEFLEELEFVPRINNLYDAKDPRVQKETAENNPTSILNSWSTVN